MGNLHITLLGRPQIWHDERLVEPPTRKTGALLFYLAVEKGLHTRDQLTALLWPESDEKRGRAALRQSLALLRQVFSQDNSSDAPKRGLPASIHHLKVVGDSLRIDPDENWSLDLSQFEAAHQLLQDWRQSKNTDREQTNEILRGLVQTLELDRGDFLEGFHLPDAPEFELWAEGQRVFWQKSAGILYEATSQLQWDLGELNSAIQTGCRWMERCPTDESACLHLMNLYRANGNRDAALIAFENFRKVLTEQVAAEPSAQITALADQLHKETTLSSPSRRSTALENQLPFVGRLEPFQKLVQVYFSAREGDLHSIFILGEAGIGKSRLVSEFRSWATSQGADWLFGKAFETGGRLPYQPMLMALRDRLERENAPDDLLGDVWLTELSRLIPELLERYPDLPAPGKEQDDAGQGRLFEAVARLGLALAQRTPLVLALDDLQWADSATLDLLHYCLERWAQERVPILFLFTVRMENFQPDTALAAWVLRLEREFPLTRLTLQALMLEDILYMSDQLRGIKQFKNLGQWLFEQSDGVPLYLHEVLKHLQEQGANQDFVKDGSELTHRENMVGLASNDFLPPRILALIQDTLSHLSAAAHSLLLAAAVLGQDFDLSQICWVMGLDELQVLPLLDELYANHMLIETGAGRITFSHDKVRLAVYLEASETRRRVLHRRAFEGLEALSVAPARLAHHAQLAGLDLAAFRYSLLAGDHDLAVFAVKNAIHHYSHAVNSLERLDGLPPGKNSLEENSWQHLYLQLGRASELEHEWTGAEKAYRKLREKAHTAHLPTWECLATNRLATLIVQSQYRIDESMALLNEAMQIARGLSDKHLLAETEWNLAQISIYRQDVQSAYLYATDALQSAREVGSAELVGRSLNAVGFALSGQGRWSDSVPIYQEALEIFSAQGNLPMQIDCLTQLSQMYLNYGDFANASAVLEQAYKLSNDIQNQWSLANCGFHLAIIALEQGRFADAQRAVMDGLKFARQIEGFAPLEILTLIIAGNIQRAMRALPSAQEYHLKALEVSKSVPLRPIPFARTIMSELCADLALSENWDAAVQWELQAQQEIDQTLLHGGLSAWYGVDALLRAGHVEAARQKVAQFEQKYRENRRYLVTLHRCQAVLANWEKQFDKAIDEYETALALADDLGLVCEIWEILTQLSGVFDQLGKRDRAAASQTSAKEIIDKLADQIDGGQNRFVFRQIALSSLGEPFRNSNG